MLFFIQHIFSIKTNNSIEELKGKNFVQEELQVSFRNEGIEGSTIFFVMDLCRKRHFRILSKNK